MKITTIKNNLVNFARRTKTDNYSKKRNSRYIKGYVFEAKPQSTINPYSTSPIGSYCEMFINSIANLRQIVQNDSDIKEQEETQDTNGENEENLPIEFSEDEILSLGDFEKKPLSFDMSDKRLSLDIYQKKAIEAYKEGKSVVVTAPTGMGKTLIAEYGIDDTLKRRKKIIYLSPLKALSNEKFAKFSELFGTYDENGNLIDSKNVGIITGDVSINPDADVLVMTTEVYRNMLASMTSDEAKESFKDFDAVIYDEFHYLKDEDRGSTWEESVIQTPKHMKQMFLSATASNANQITNWLYKLNPTKEVELVKVDEKERYIPLEEYLFEYDKKSHIHSLKPIFIRRINPKQLLRNPSNRVKQCIEELETICKKPIWKILNSVKNKDGYVDTKDFEKVLTDKEKIEKNKAQQISLILSDPDYLKDTDVTFSSYYRHASLVQLAKILTKEQKTPALFFIFSKKKCKKLLEAISQRNGNLLTRKEQLKAYKIIQDAKKSGIYLGEDFESEYEQKLLQGYAVHHAGMLPAYKSLVEKLAREGLVKNCFATETLLAGINMPFKTVVFETFMKADSHGVGIIPATTYKQGAGRAGRRGIDLVGNVIITPTSFSEYETYKKIMRSSNTNINSAFNPSYAMAMQKNILNKQNDYIAKTFAVFQSNSPETVMDELVRKTNYLIKKGYIKELNGKKTLTTKGEIAQSIYGINPILLTEIITDKKYTQSLTPEELVGLISIFADVKDQNPKEQFQDAYKEYQDKYQDSIDLAKEINKEQSADKIYENIKLSVNLVPSILSFAYAPKFASIQVWKEIFEDLQNSGTLSHEGDLLRVVNNTVDILQTICEVTPDKELARKAKDAILCLKKPPVIDITRYELNIGLPTKSVN